jgi:hypothetical protein
VEREGIELTTGFNATVNVDLRVGEVNETITVTGESPVVDTRNVIQQRVMTRDVIDAIPTAKNFANLAALIPGTTLFGYGRAQDVGGSNGHSNQGVMIHGSKFGMQEPMIDGMRVGFGGGSFMTLSYADSNTEEINLGITNISAEAETGGVRVNIIPRSGGNELTGTVFGSYTNEALQSDNLDDALRARGLTAVDRIDYLSDVSGALGGPIVRDRLWFFGGYRNWDTKRFGTIRFDSDPTDWRYTPDLTRDPAKLDKENWNASTRFT